MTENINEENLNEWAAEAAEAGKVNLNDGTSPKREIVMPPGGDSKAAVYSYGTQKKKRSAAPIVAGVIVAALAAGGAGFAIGGGNPLDVLRGDTSSSTATVSLASTDSSSSSSDATGSTAASSTTSSAATSSSTGSTTSSASASSSSSSSATSSAADSSAASSTEAQTAEGSTGSGDATQGSAEQAAATQPEAQPEQAAPVQEVQPEYSNSTEAAPAPSGGSFHEGDPFWGVWVGAFSSKANAEARQQEMRNLGYPDPRIYWSADYTDLNQEGYWVVAAGIYDSESNAKYHLDKAKGAYSDAYVKYSGSHK